MTTPTASPALSPFDLMAYQRDHVPDAARTGMRGYILNILIGMARLEGSRRGLCIASASYLAKTIVRPVKHVRRDLAALEAMGEIERVTQRKGRCEDVPCLHRMSGLLRWADATPVQKSAKARGAILTVEVSA